MIAPETIDTVTPLWAWIAGIVFAVVAICWAIGQERTATRDDIDELIDQRRDRMRAGTRDI